MKVTFFFLDYSYTYLPNCYPQGYEEDVDFGDFEII